MSTSAGYFPMNDTVVQGDTQPYTMYFKDADENPLDVSTWEFFHTIKTAIADTDANAVSTSDPSDFTVSNGNGTNDKVTWSVAKETTAAMVVATYFQDLQVIRSGGVLRTYGKGQFVVEDQVTIRTAAL